MGNPCSEDKSGNVARNQIIRIHPKLCGLQRRRKIKEIIRNLLIKIGEDPDREGLQKTPERVESLYGSLTSGYKADADKIINSALFHEECDDMVVLKDIEMHSLCEHHLLPFFGKCHVAYIPKGKIVGLSKIPRIVDVFCQRLQVQERLTSQIADCLNKALQPDGVAVVIEAVHLCMAMRGVRKQEVYTTTSAMRGSFKLDPKTRSEFLSFINRKSSL